MNKPVPNRENSGSIDVIIATDVEKCDLLLADLEGEGDAVRVGDTHGVEARELPPQLVKVEVLLKRVVFQGEQHLLHPILQIRMRAKKPPEATLETDRDNERVGHDP
jgi:hypothetical protein